MKRMERLTQPEPKSYSKGIIKANRHIGRGINKQTRERDPSAYGNITNDRSGVTESEWRKDQKSTTKERETWLG